MFCVPDHMLFHHIICTKIEQLNLEASLIASPDLPRCVYASEAVKAIKVPHVMDHYVRLVISNSHCKHCQHHHVHNVTSRIATPHNVIYNNQQLSVLRSKQRECLIVANQNIIASTHESALTLLGNGVLCR
jgi:hypothetical protein